MVNVWRLDLQIAVTDSPLEALANFNFDEMTDPQDISPFLPNAHTGQKHIRSLLYAMIEGRPDFDSNLIKDDYIRGRSWNLVCDSNVVQAASFVPDTFLGETVTPPNPLPALVADRPWSNWKTRHHE